MEDKYRQAEDEYFKLRGQFDTGRLAQEQFDEKIRELMVQDKQGRYWMLGADSGKWYVYDGTKWVQADPYPDMPPPAAVPARPTTLPPSSISSSGQRPAPTPIPPTPGARQFPLVPVVIGLVILALALAAFLLFQNRDRIFVAQPQQITPVLPPTITRAPSPTFVAAQPTGSVPTLPAIPTAAFTPLPPPSVAVTVPSLATAQPTPAQVTVAPAITIIVVTAVPFATDALPTLLPTANIPATLQPTAIPTVPPPTESPTAVPATNTPPPDCPAGVCVTGISYTPNPPKRNQDITFAATFVNNTGSTQLYPFIVLLFDPNKAGSNKGFGESPPINISVPPGVSTSEVTYTAVTGPGGCVSLYAQAGWKQSQFQKPIFPNSDGQPLSVYFDVCPD